LHTSPNITTAIKFRVKWEWDKKRIQNFSPKEPEGKTPRRIPRGRLEDNNRPKETGMYEGGRQAQRNRERTAGA
jgi:hypothetical protein